MSDLHSYSQRSDGPTVDALALKLTGDTSLETDLKRTQEIEVTVRGVVTGHTITDKRDKNGDIIQTVKIATVKVDELVEIQILTVPRRMKGQTAFPIDGEAHEEPPGSEMIVSGQVYGDEGDVPDAIVVPELEAGPRPPGVDENGEVVQQGEIVNGMCSICSATDANESCSPDDPRPGCPLHPSSDVPKPEPGPVDRHPQVAEDAWRELNHEQRLDVAQRMDRIAAQQSAIAESRNATDVAAAQTHLDGALKALHADYGIVLLPADSIEKADADISADEKPPAPVTATSPIVAPAELQRRRRYLLAKQGMPAEMEAARQDELAEIDKRLGAGAPG